MDEHKLFDFIEPAIREAQTHRYKPQAFLITPGSDWPADVEKPTEPMVFIPRIPNALMKRVPPETLRGIRNYAEQIVGELGLPPDITLAELAERNNATSPAPEDKSLPPTHTSPAVKRQPGWGHRIIAPALIATAGIMAQADASNPSSAASPPRRAAVSTLEGMASDSQRRRHSPNQRAGVTLVEVLVVIGIIGILAGLTVPAVMKARDAAHEMAYKNNMRQVGLAIHNFEAGRGRFPFATSMVPNDRGVLIPHSWVVDILPHLDQGALYNQYDKKKPYDAQAPEVQNAVISVLNHPAYPLEPGRMRMAALSSSGLSATNPPDIASQNGIARDYLLSPQPTDFRVAMPPQWVMNASGRWQQNSSSSIGSIRDGASNTAMVAAHCHEEGNRDPWLADPQNPGGKTRITGLMFGTEVGQSRVNGGLTGNVYQPQNFVTNHVISSDGSRHPEKHTVLFADGSVRKVAPTGPQGASFNTPEALRWQEMVTRDDGKSPSDDLTK